MQVHRFRDLVAASLGTGPTVYLTPDEAERIVYAMANVVGDVRLRTFSESKAGTYSEPTPKDADQSGRDAPAIVRHYQPTIAADAPRRPYVVTFWTGDDLGAYVQRVSAQSPAQALYLAVSRSHGGTVQRHINRRAFRAVVAWGLGEVEAFEDGHNAMALLENRRETYTPKKR